MTDDRSPLLRYGVAVLSVTVAFVVTALIPPLIERATLVLFFAAVIISSWYGGLRPGLLAILLSVLLNNFFLIGPDFSFKLDLESLVRLITFAPVAVLIIYLIAARERAYREAREAIAMREEALKLRDEHLSREQAARAEAVTANRAKDEFLATVSHELRTPLNAILGWAHMLRTGRLDEGAKARAFETIERNARSQAKLVEDLLDISRIITGKLNLNLRPMELPSVMSAAIEAVRLAAQTKSIELSQSVDQSVGPISGDPNRLQQVMWNLMSNAIKFTPPGGRIDVRLERAGPNARIVVSDTGQGISPAFLPYVFERFRQADGATARSQSGLGLGLAIVRHLVELHGGSVRAESPGEGQGASFIVTLPLIEEQIKKQADPRPVD